MGGGGGGATSSPHPPRNHLRHLVPILQHLNIAETHHLITKPIQKHSPLVVMPELLLVSMMRTIQLHNELRIDTNEIDDERTHRLLPAKL